MTMSEEEVTETAEEVEPVEQEPETFDLEYVTKLRQESATHRVAAREAGEMIDRFKVAVKASALREAAGQHLADPTDLPWSEEFWQADGLPDEVRISDAARMLADEKPHLARPRGDIGQGIRGDNSGTVDIANLLRGLA